MYQITDQLKKIGFSINLLSDVIKRNSNNKTFSTLDYFCIFLITEDLSIKVENRYYHIEAGNAVFLGPQKSIEFSDTDGENIYGIGFSSAFYERSSKDSLFLNSTIFFNCKSEIFVAPYFGDIHYINTVLVKRLLNFQSGDENLYISSAHNAIEALILDAFLHVDCENTEKDEKLEYVSFVNRFRVLLQRDFKKTKKVSYYAEELAVSPRKLTEMTECVSGQTAKQVIIEKIVSESIKAIQFSTDTISEISYDLGFSNEGNFTNFVKKYTGKNPTEMRELVV